MNIASEAYIYLRATEQQAPAMILVLVVDKLGRRLDSSSFRVSARTHPTPPQTNQELELRLNEPLARVHRRPCSGVYVGVSPLCALLVPCRCEQHGRFKAGLPRRWGPQCGAGQSGAAYHCWGPMFPVDACNSSQRFRAVDFRYSGTLFWLYARPSATRLLLLQYQGRIMPMLL